MPRTRVYAGLLIGPRNTKHHPARNVLLVHAPHPNLRIKKCLDRANHPNTPEAEAKAALHIASRLMGQYNVSQAEVLAHGSHQEQKEYAGQSVVSIVRVDGDKFKPVRQQFYVSNLALAIKTFFDCKYYSTSGYSYLDYTFYGIAQNTVAAAMAFEMVYNLIAEWARPYKGIGTKNSYCHGVCDEFLWDARREKANEEAQAKRAEVEAISEKEKKHEAERSTQLARLAPLDESQDLSSAAPKPVKIEHDDFVQRSEYNLAGNDYTTSFTDGDYKLDIDDDDGLGYDIGPTDGDVEGWEDVAQPDFEIKDEGNLDVFGDLDREIENLIKPEPPSSEASFDAGFPSAHSVPPSLNQHGQLHNVSDAKTLSTEEKDELKPGNELELKWSSHTQLVTFRNTATKIAEDYLKETGLKLRNARSRSRCIQDYAAYKQGKKDSKKIDVHQKRITQ